MSVLYRKRLRNGKAVRTTLTFSPKTLTGLNELRQRFQSRWPEASYPSLSYVLEIVLAKNIPLFDNHPVMMERALQEFRRKYPKGTRPGGLGTQPKQPELSSTTTESEKV